jgi:hypothetical protein
VSVSCSSCLPLSFPSLAVFFFLSSVIPLRFPLLVFHHGLSPSPSCCLSSGFYN